MMQDQNLPPMDPVLALEISASAKLRTINEATEKGNSNIQKTYSGATVFVTGASGFLGKHLVEKLLRSTDTKRIFVLLRPKKGKAVQERLSDILADPVFESLRKQKADFARRIIAVTGDITELKLGICEQDWKLLTEEVNFIFHGAATTRFDEVLTTATITNVRGTREVLNLGRDCKNLRALVYISTAFSHATLSRRNKLVSEQFYEVPVSPQLLLEMAESDALTLDHVTHFLIKDWPNTYCFTKAVAEELVRTSSDGMPVCVVRPSIVIGAYREPTPGWVDMSCAYGPAGVMIGVGLGLFHVIYADTETKIDIVPVDFVNNAVIAAGWVTATNKTPLTVYTCCSNRNPITWGACGTVLRRETRKISTPKAVWYCYAMETSSRFVYWMLFWLLHYIPAYFIDAVCILSGRKRQFVKLYTKAYKLFTLFSYFTTNSWIFGDKNLQLLYSRMSETDKQIYSFDVECIEWQDLMLIWCMGLRKYIVKDGLTDTDYAVKKQFWLRILNAIVMVFYAYLWYKVISILYKVIFY